VGEKRESRQVLRSLSGYEVLAANEKHERQLEQASKRIDEQRNRINKLVELFQREFYFLKNRGFIGPATLEFDERLHGTTSRRRRREHPPGCCISN